MMIDQMLVLVDAQAVAAAGALTGTNVLDMGTPRDLGSGEPLWVVVTVTGVVSGTSPTLVVILKADSVVGMGTAIVKYTSPALVLPLVATAGLVCGQYAFRVPPGLPRQFWRLDGTAGGTTPAFNWSASIVKDVELKLHSRQLLSF